MVLGIILPGSTARARDRIIIPRIEMIVCRTIAILDLLISKIGRVTDVAADFTEGPDGPIVAAGFEFVEPFVGVLSPPMKMLPVMLFHVSLR